MRTNAELTLYNRFYDPSTKVEVYVMKHVLQAVWEDRKAVSSEGKLADYQARIYIPMAGAVNFVSPAVWKALPDKNEKWTLQIDDLVVKGIVYDELGASFTPSQLRAKYPSALKIISIDTLDLGRSSMWHWLLGAS